ncbi:MAG: hypothetical protein QW812_04195 [Thermoplasmataceae archaeon]
MLNPESLINQIESAAYLIMFRYRIEFFLIFSIVFAGRKFIHVFRGHRYSSRSLVLSPLLYFAFSTAALYGFNSLDILISSIAFLMGLMFSSFVRSGVRFYEREGVLYYRRSFLIVLVWTAAFLVRIYVLLFYDITAGLFLGVILTALTGLIIGEAFQIAVHKRLFDYRKHNMETAAQSSKTVIADEERRNV